MQVPSASPKPSSPGRLDINRIGKRFGSVAAVDDVSLNVSAAEFLTILGPSGSGKTTLLKIIAGFENPDFGSVLLDDVDITDISPATRNIGMVFQNYALFPHMTIARNIAYPLVMRRVPKAEIAARVHDALNMVELDGYGDRMPRQASGGQQQRVALARAIVFHPRLLLLDEPFGALDRKLRDQMQLEVRRLQQKMGLTTIFITHDQEEALVMSDRIAVMDKGRVSQIGSPQEIYETPTSQFVADFVGESNIFVGKVLRTGSEIELELDFGTVWRMARGPTVMADVGQRVRVMIRPERFVAMDGGAAAALANNVSGEITECAYTGTSDRYRVQSVDGINLLVRFQSAHGARRYRQGESITIGFSPNDLRLIEVV
jgi:putative spermidine/putrescine transport system ATP-binding protein